MAGGALVVGALMALAGPGVAYADTVSVTVRTPGATAGPTRTSADVWALRADDGV
ncbi:hypothetical protein SAZ_06230 [Streptomyces noursei ZPM]|nr:hypothetical protein SAZ_06230 [Streptomyces noursei ZPM]EOS98393.2 hypothetical protein K530_39221 [Streptomyces noursei CCRC 11814]